MKQTTLNITLKKNSRSHNKLRWVAVMAVMMAWTVPAMAQISDGVYYIQNDNSATHGYLWPSVTTNSSTGYRYLTTSLDTIAEVVNNNGVYYPAHDQSYSHWVVKNVDGGFIQLINPRLNKYVVIRAFPKTNNTKPSQYGDRDVWLTEEPDAENIEYSYLKLYNNASPYKISPKPELNGVNTTSGYSLNSAAGNDRVWLTWSQAAENKPKTGEGRDGLIQFYSGGTPQWSFTSDLLDAPTISAVNSTTNIVTVDDANGLPEGYNVRYTVSFDGINPADPTASSPIMTDRQYTVEQTCIIKAVVERYDVVLTSVATMTLVPYPCATPVISFDYTTSKVSITCATPNTTIHYTTNGNTPTASSTEYGEPFSVTGNTTVKAIAIRENFLDSEVAELAISQVATPTIQNNGSNAISITSATPGATIYYTLDGTTPTTSSYEYTAPLHENVSNVTIKAIAIKENMIPSAVGSGSVILQCATPVITRIGLTFTLSCSMPTDAKLYYTLEGGDEVLYDGPVSFSPDHLPMIVTAIARHGDYTDSETAELELKNGSGTPDDPFLIYGDTDYANFVANVNNGTTASAWYKLGIDITATDTEITTPFTGVFDGDSHSITGLSHPLFNTVDGGVVKNVTLKSVNINSKAADVGAIAGVAKGYSRIYNCGILPNSDDFPQGTHPLVKTTGRCAGGLVGCLKGDSRVVNCYSYADVQALDTASGIVGNNTFASTALAKDDKYANLRTAIVNCMFYGDIYVAEYQYGVYGGELITNAAATGISSYNYFRNGSKFTAANGHPNTSGGDNVIGNPTAYNCSFPADERYLTQVEFHRSLLNSNRELCGWWVGSDVTPSTLTTTEVQAIPKDASLMYKWVVDPNIAPYPILKPFGKYPSIVNGNTGTPWFDRTTAEPYQGKQLGTLTVNVQSGAQSEAAEQTLEIPITDMDTLHYDFGYRKVQLPYYNTVFGDPGSDDWAEKYAGNYSDYVVTGWMVTDVQGGTPGTFDGSSENAWEIGYNFADRLCTDKDKYSVSGRVFAQGGFYYVPDDVTEITIEAYWGKAIYVRNNENSYDRVNITLANTGSHFAPAGTRDNNVNDATINTSIRGALKNIDAKRTVYDYALVLVGNVQESVGKNDVKYADKDYRGFTLMSVDLDFDEEPDYCLEWQLGAEMARQIISPIRFDFLPVVELGIAGKLNGSTNFFSLGCYRSQGHFEVTETSFIRFGQFEFELETRDEGPIILNGGIYDQYCRGRNKETNQHINYVILGGHVVMPSFTPGAHVAANYQTRHCAVNVLGGDFTSFYLTGGYREDVTPFDDNPHCYIDGGRFGTVAAAFKEGIKGDVTWRINHALIREFYGGGVMADDNKIVKGSIDVVIDNSIVGKYCGGPKFGDMVKDKTVTTSATGTTFKHYFGAGNGGTNYMQYASTDDSQHGPLTPETWATTINKNYTPTHYRSKAQGYEADYEIEVINTSTGDLTGRVINRSYYYSAQFATTNTGDVDNTLTNCTVKYNFYGAGFLGGVNGKVTSVLTDTHVLGSVYGAGYSASSGTVTIQNKDKTPPEANIFTGMITNNPGGTSTTYTWTNDSGSTSSPVTPTGNLFYTEIPLTKLGAVSQDVTLTLDGGTTVEFHVFGGGEQSSVMGNTTVKIQQGAHVVGNVYGGGNEGPVGGDSKVIIQDESE